MKSILPQLFYHTAFALTAALSAAQSAHAVTMKPVGDPYVTGSWIQNFDIIDGFFDTVELFVVADGGGGPFEAPGLENIVDFGFGGVWSGSLVNPEYILAAGDSTFWLNADLHFAGDIGSVVTLDLLFWDGGVDGFLADSIRLAYDGEGTFFSEFVPDEVSYDREPSSVPDGGTTVGLLGACLCGLLCVRRRLNKYATGLGA